MLKTSLMIRDIDDLSLILLNSTHSPTSVIACSNESIVIDFTNIKNVYVSGLIFRECGGSRIKFVCSFTLVDSGFQDQNESAVLLNGTYANIIRCQFRSNNGSNQYDVIDSSHVYSVGGAVYCFNCYSTITISESYFEGNNAQLVGAIFGTEYSIVTITNSTFFGSITNNDVIILCGESIYAGTGVTVNIESSFFTKNDRGEVMHLCNGDNHSKVNIVSSLFFNNSAGVILTAIKDGCHCSGQPRKVTTVSVNITASNFTSNLGIVVHLIMDSDVYMDIHNNYYYADLNASNVNIVSSHFDSNSGKAVLLARSEPSIPVKTKSDLKFVNIEKSVFTNNEGIVVYMNTQNDPSTMNIVFSQFCNNSGGPVIFAKSNMEYGSEQLSTSINIASSNFTGNFGGAILTSDCSIDSSCDDSTVVKITNSNFLNNSGSHGAVYGLFVDISDSNFYGNSDRAVNALFGINLTNSNFTHNFNNNITTQHIQTLPSAGGAVYAGGETSISRCYFLYNEALYRSDLVSIANSRTMISGNKAGDEGGGIYAISSSVIVYHKNEAINYYDKHVRFWVYTNEAKRGGGLYMGLSAKLYILQYQYTTINDVDASFFPVIFEANCANYGGAIYVDDETNFGTCESSSSDKYSTATECFMQSIMLYNRDMPLSPDDTGLLIETVVTEFIQNNAIISGSDLFGGLLDRCTVSPFAEVHYVNSSCEKNVTGFSYFTCMTSISASNQEEYRQNTTIINSGPVQLCFCTDGQPDCNHLLPSVHVKKGELFQVELVAVDQVNNVIPDVIVHSFLSGSESSLANGPLNQKTESYYCTTLKFRITSPQSSESLTLYAEGPCKDACLPSSEKCECLFQRVLMPKLFPAKKRKYEFYL